MSVLPSDITLYGCANMPEADGSTVGGAPDFTKKIDFTNVGSNDTLDCVSDSSSDTATKLTYLCRSTTGAPVTVTGVTLNGTTPVTGSQTTERLLAAVISGGAIAGLTSPGGTTAVGDIALYQHTAAISGHTAQTGSANASGTTPALFKLQSGDGASVSVGQIIRITSGTGQYQLRRIIAITGYGTDVVAVSRNWSTVPDNTSVYSILNGMLFDISPNAILAITTMFINSAAAVPGGSTTYYYDKGFVVNNNTATALLPQSGNTGVGVEIASNTPSLPSGVLLDLGPGTSYDDSLTITNRQTAPSGITFTTQPANVFMPSPGTLPPGSAPNTAGTVALWFRLTIPAGSTPYAGSPLIETTGITT